MSVPGSGLAAERIVVEGVVQGVGFRPFVARVARSLGVAGSVRNTPAGVEIDAVASPSTLAELARHITSEPPPAAVVLDVSRTRRALPGDPVQGFTIDRSTVACAPTTPIGPDLATCDACRSELFDPGNRRYRHPFITCTDCGPRFTIVEDLPYDRPNTTMRRFSMCDACAREYAAPNDRRYHAEPIACHDCGPTLALRRGSGVPHVTGAAAIAEAVRHLRSGAIVAIKGIGGYHLACDASNDQAVGEIRRRKGRADKPFALMVADVQAAESCVRLSESERAALTSPSAPIVIARAAAHAPVSPLVSPANPTLGVLLPYTPVHHLLFADGAPALVMTSANVVDEPIAYTDDDATSRLPSLADVVLDHDRPIHVPCDDSVIRIDGPRRTVLRRSRGLAPVPILTGAPDDRPTVLATGGDLKNTFCLASGRVAWMSQHLGDMGHLRTLEALEQGVERVERLYVLTPSRTAVDNHPAYSTTRWAQAREGVRIRVQHHHAHIASLIAEHRRDPAQRVIGVAFDGTGHGDDGTTWGGEFLLADAATAERIAHLRAIALPGGDRSARVPARSALAHLHAAGVPWRRHLPPIGALNRAERGLLARELSAAPASPSGRNSSMGRLFDAVASILDLHHRTSFEGQAAMALEFAAADEPSDGWYAFGFDGRTIDPAPVIRAVTADHLSGVGTAAIARRFHESVAVMIAEVASHLRDRAATATVALSGGVFQNALLTSLAERRLCDVGFEVLTHHLVPPNDGGLALGQALIGQQRAPSARCEATTDSMRKDR